MNGAYQGAVFPFIRPLSSSSYSTAFDPQGRLWVGSVGRGWTPGEPAIEIIAYDDSKIPFEIHRIALAKDGFDIHFTQPIKASQISAADIFVGNYQYEYWDGYGSEPINERVIPVTRTTLSSDRKTLSITLLLQADSIYQIELPELESTSGLVLENNFGIYTLNQLLP